MCLAIYKPKNKLFPDYALLKRAWLYNEDGAGLAICRGDHVEIIKGIMTFNELILCLNKDLVGHDVVIHLRYATSGEVNRGMTHPFPITKNNAELLSLNIKTDKALIHNGVMFSPKMDSGYSDTAIFSKYLALKPDISESEIFKIIKSDRLAIVSGDDVKLIGSWHESEDDGLFYSNLSAHETVKESYYNPSRFNDPHYFQDDYAFFDSKRDHDSELDYCPICGSDHTEIIGIKTIAMECLTCGAIYNETHFLESEIVESEIA